MRFLADECVDASVVRALRAAGHDVRSVQEISAGMTDAKVLEAAAEENRVVITEDKDFGYHAFRQRTSVVPGVVLMRIDPSARQSKWPRLARAIERFGDGLIGHYTVVGPSRLRSRPLRER